MDKVQYNSKIVLLIDRENKQLYHLSPKRMSQENDNENSITTSRAKNNQNQSISNQFKLPRLAPPPSRGRIASRKENKAPTYLPSIQGQSDEQRNFRNTETIHVSRSENDIIRSENQSVGESFQLQVEDKLKIMMQQDQTKTNQQFQEDQNYKSDDLSDDLDFQQKILQNKQIIKMHRKKNQPVVQKKKPLQILDKYSDNRPKFGKPQSNYERKMKQYNLSLENKYLQRKKQSLGIIQQKVQKQPLQRAKSKKVIPNIQQPQTNNQVKSNFGYKQFKNSAIGKSQSRDPQRPNIPMSGNKSNNQQLSKSQRGQKLIFKQNNKTQQPPSPSKRVHRTSALFDNIQSFLQNPTAPDKHEKFYRQLFKKLKSKSIPKLEEKLRQINEKLGTNQNFETKSTFAKQDNNEPILLTQNPLDRTVRDWKRVDIKEKSLLKCKQSDFEKELQYISYLQQKNSASLSRFVDHQKLMIELQINKRFAKSNNQDKPSQTKQSNASQQSVQEKS